MFVSRSARLVARVGQRRTFVDGLVSKNSKVEEMRKIHNAGGVTQGAPNPTYLKQNGDMASFAVGMGLITFALLKLSNGYWNMAHGTGKLD
ncbi:hypothetical protein TrLO_g9037 [Triparma laevis f. longispina]|uniref:Uncharacterized protein n=1 Tax=Triparma laevis f. longispina TaxID=1714387 RepID=A0A9W7KTH3_9STRA|nr:hypothetical protein TrLO_g9037 [Triparma laevis f. longispina]